MPHYRANQGPGLFDGTYWPAQVYEGATDANYALAVSSWVTVVGRQGLTLLVAPGAAAYT